MIRSKLKEGKFVDPSWQFLQFVRRHPTETSKQPYIKLKLYNKNIYNEMRI